MIIMFSYETVSEAVDDLSRRGYVEDFIVNDDCIYCKQNETRLNPKEFVIDEYYRFEGDSDPADETIVYAISSIHKPLKGILVNAYGVYADSLSDELVEKLTVRK